MGGAERTEDAAADAPRQPAAEQELRLQAPRPARNGVASWGVTLAAMMMAFLASLALATTIAANRLANSWTGLAHSATVTLPPHVDEDAYARIIDALESHPGVMSVAPVDRELAEAEMAALLGGDAALAARLDLAPLIDVEFAARAVDAAPVLERRLASQGLQAWVQPNSAVAERLTEAAAEVRNFAFVALGVIAATAGMMVALACVSALAAHAEMVDVLRLIGARDGFIAQLFERPLQLNTFIGAALGAAVAFGLAAWPSVTEGRLFELAPLLPDLRPAIDDWPLFVTVPLAFALIATVAARGAVAVALRRPER